MSALHSLYISSTLSLPDQGLADNPSTDQQACSLVGGGARFLLLLVTQKLAIGEKVCGISVVGLGKKMLKKLGVRNLLETCLET